MAAAHLDELGGGTALRAGGDRHSRVRGRAVEVVAPRPPSGREVKAVGSGHSFTDCACTDGVMVDLAGMQRVLDVDEAAAG